MKQINKVALFILLMSFTFYSSAQDAYKQKEIGLSFESLKSIGLNFKSGTNKSMWRFNVLAFNGSFYNRDSQFEESENKSIGLNLSFGKEYLYIIETDFEFKIGADLSLSYRFLKYEVFQQNIIDNYTPLSHNIIPGLKIILGANYIINENLLLGFELKPHIYTIMDIENFSASQSERNIAFELWDNLLVNITYRLKSK